MTDAIATTHEHFRLAVGDVVRLAEGECLVFRVNASCATCAPLQASYREFIPTFSDKPVKVRVSQSLIRISANSEVEIVERRGVRGVVEFNKPKQKANIMRIETGEVIMWSTEQTDPPSGERYTVVAVDDKHARIAAFVGDKIVTEIIARNINEFYLAQKPRRTEHERKCELDNFLKAYAAGREDELTKPIGSEEIQNMATKINKKPLKPVTKPISAPRGGLAAEAMAASGECQAALETAAPQSHHENIPDVLLSITVFSRVLRAALWCPYTKLLNRLNSL